MKRIKPKLIRLYLDNPPIRTYLFIFITTLLLGIPQGMSVEINVGKRPNRLPPQTLGILEVLDVENVWGTQHKYKTKRESGIF